MRGGATTLRGRTSAAAIATALIGLPISTPVLADGIILPTGGQVVAGSATLTNGASAVTVDQSSARAIVDWQTFSIGAGGKVNFNNGTGATLNRVTGGNLSTIAGQLSATGSVYLINPAGIVVDGGGKVLTGGSFVASTRMVDAPAFMAGGDLSFSGNSTGGVSNRGSIAAGGDVVLIGAMTSNAGDISAGGTVAMAAAQRIVLRAVGEDGRIMVDGGTGDVTNTGAITAAAAELKSAGGNVYALAGNNGGIVAATGSAMQGGRVWLDAGADVVVASAVTAKNADGSGGTVHVLGTNIALKDGAKIDVSGTKGGIALIGGDYLGGQSADRKYSDVALKTAATLTMAAGATINADGGVGSSGAGSGGAVVLWSDKATRFRGSISVSGGDVSGDGGFIETSSKGWLDFLGSVKASAKNGAAGLVLLDPASITIQATSPDLNGDATTGDDLVTGTIAAGDNGAAASVITSGAIQSILEAGTNVSLAATNSITWASGADITVALGSTRSLTLATTTATTGIITLNSSITATGSALNLNLTSDQINLAAGTYTLNGGTATIATSSTNRNVDIGAADAAGLLGLTDAELDRIITGSAGILSVTANGTGTLNISAAQTRATAGTTNLSGGTFTQAVAGTWTASAANQTLNLAATTADSGVLTLNANITGSSIVLNLGLTADRMALTAGTYTLNNGAASITTTSNNKNIDLGAADSATLLGLTDAELDRVVNGNTGSLSITGKGTATLNLSAAASRPTSGGGTITLQADSITQAGAGTWASVATVATTLNLITNNIALAGNVTNSSNVASVTRVQTLTGSRNIDLGTNTAGTVALTDAELDFLLVNASGRLEIATTTGTINVSAAITRAAATNLVLIADRMTIGQSVNTSVGSLSLNPGTVGANIDIGSGTDANTGTLELSDTELDLLTTGVLRIGARSANGSPIAGNVTVTAAVTPTVPNALALYATGNITDNSGAGSLAAATRILRATVSGASSAISLTSASNAFATVALSSSGTGAIGYRDADAIILGAVDGLNGISASGADVSIQAGGAVTQTQAIIAAGLGVRTSAGAVITLGNAGNNIGRLAVAITGGTAASGASCVNVDSSCATLNNGSNSFSVGSIAAVGGISSFTGITTDGTGSGAGRITLTTTGTLTQTASVQGNELVLNGTNGTYTLTNTGNDFALLQALIGTGTLTYVDSSALAIFAVSGNGITAGTASLTAGGALTQNATTIAVTNLRATSTGGLINLSGASNTIGTVAASATNGAITLRDTAGGLIVGTVDGVSGIASATPAAVTITTTGGLTQTSGITASALSLTNITSGAIVATHASNAFSSLTVSNTVGDSSVSENNATGFAVSGITATARNVTLSSAGGTVTQTGGIATTTGGLELLGTGATYTLTNTGGTNNIARLAGNTGTVSYTQAAAFAVGTQNTVGLTTTDGSALTVTTAAATLTVTDGISNTTSGDIALRADRMVLSNNITNTGRVVSLTPNATARAIDLGSATDAGAGLELSDTELDRITASTVRVSGQGASNITVTAANVGPNSAGALSLVTSGAGTISQTGGGSVNRTVNLGGAVADDGSLGLRLSSAAATTFNAAANNIGTLSIVSGNTAIQFTDSSGFEIGTVDTGLGISSGSGTTTLTAGGAVTQTQALTALNLQLLGASADYTLTNAANAITTIAGNAASVAYVDTDAFAVGTVTTVGLTTSGVTSLTAGVNGALTQSQLISASGLRASTSGTGTITLTVAANNVATLALTTANQSASFTDTNGFQIATVNGAAGINTGTGAVTLTAGAAVTQSGTGNLVGGALTLVGTSSDYTLTNTGNDVTSITGSGNLVSLAFVDANSLTANAITTTGASGLSLTASAVTPSTTALTINGALNTSNAGNISLSADQMTISASVTAGAARVATLTSTTSGKAINIGGADSNSTLGLDATDLGNITAGTGTLRVGSVTAGAITLSAATTPNATTVSLITGSTIAQTGAGAVNATNLRITATGNVDLSTNSNTVTNVAISSPGGSAIQFRDNNGFTIASVDGVTTTDLGTGTLSLFTGSGNSVTQSVRIIAANLELSGAGGVFTLTDANNDIDTLAAATGTVTLTDVDGVAIGTAGGTNGVTTSGATTLTAGANVTQGGAANQLVSATTLSVTTTGTGTITLANSSNAVTNLSLTTANQNASFRDSNGFVLAATSLGAGTLTLEAGGAVTQTGALTASALELLGAAGAYTLDNVGNAIATLAGNTASVDYLDTDGFAVGTVNTAGLTTSGATSLRGGTNGNITQSQAIVAASLRASTTGTGTISLTNTSNNVTTLALSTANQNASFRDSNGFDIGTASGINGTNVGSGNLTLNAGGAVTQSQDIIASGLELLGGNEFSLFRTTNNIVTLAGNTASLAYVDADSFTVGTVNTAGLSMGGGTLTATATNSTITVANAITSSGNLTLNADRMAINTTVNAGANIVTLAPVTAARLIDLGSATDAGVNLLELSDAELDQITATTVRIGSGAAGAISVTAAGVGPNSATNLSLLSAAGVSQTGAGSITVANLKINAEGVVALGTNSNAVTTMTARSGGNAISFRDDSGFVIGTVDGQNGIDSGAGNTTLRSGAAVTQTQVITAAGLELLGAGGAYTLDNAGNAITTLAGNTASVDYLDTDGFAVGTVNTAGLTTTGATSLRAGTNGNVTQSQAIVAASLRASTTGTGTIALTNASNNVTTLALSTANQTASFRDSNGFDIGTASGVNGTNVGSGNLTLNAGGAVTQSQDITASGLELLGGNTVTLGRATNNIATLAGTTGSLSYVDADSFAVGTVNSTGLTTGAATLTATAANATLTVAQAITASGDVNLNADRMALNAAINAGANIVTLAAVTASRLIDLGSATDAGVNLLELSDAELDQITATTVRVGSGAAGAIAVTAAGVGPNSATNLSLITGAGISQTGAGAITVSGLRISANGAVALGTNANDVTTVAAASGGNAISFNDANSFAIGTVDTVSGINSGAANTTLTGGGAVTQTQAITAAGLELLGGGAAYTLANAGNAITTLAGNTASVDYLDADGFTVGTVNTAGLTTSGAASLRAGTNGNLTQSAAIVADGFRASTTGTGTITLTNASNNVATLALSTANQNASFRDSSGFIIGTASGINGANVGSGNLTLNAGNTVTQTQAVTAAGLELLGAVGYTLGNASNAITTLAGNAASVDYLDTDGFDVGTVNTAGLTTSGATSLQAGTNGNLTQSTAIVANSLRASTTGTGTITLANAANDVGTLALTTANQNASFRDANGFAIGTASGVNGINVGSGAATLTAGAAVTQSQIVTAASLSLNGTGGAYTLASNNQVGSVGGNTGSIDFNNTLAAGLTVTTTTVATTAKITANNGNTGNLVVGATMTSSASSGDSIVLATSANFVGTGATINPGSGSARYLVFTNNAGDAAEYDATTKGGLIGGNFYNTPFNFGTRAVNAVSATGNRFVYADQPTLTVTINPVTNVIYTGLTPAASVGMPTGVRGGDSNAEAFQGAAGTTGGGITPNVGTYNGVTATLGSLTSPIGYAFAFAGPGSVVVAPAPLTITVDGKSKTYGDADPALTFSVAGLVNGETIGTGLNGAGTTYTANSTTTGTNITNALTRAAGENVVGSPYAISTGAGLTATSNYTIQTVNAGALSITARNTTISVNAGQSKVYGATDPTLTFTVNNLGGADTSTGVATGSLARAAGESVLGGPYAITQGTLTLNANYNVTGFTGANFTITAKTLTATLVGTTTKQYNATTGASLVSGNYSITGFVGGEGATVTQTVGAYDTKAVGTGKTVTATLAGGDFTATGGAVFSNYVLPTTAMGAIGSITAAPLTVSGLTGSNRTYDGTTTASFTGTAALAGLFGGDAVTLGGAGTGSFATKHVGTAKAITVTGFTATGGDAGNYVFTQPTGLTANVTAKALTVNAVSDTKIYDRTTSSGQTVTAVGLVGGDTTSALSQAFNLKDASAVNGRTLTVGTFTVNDGNGGNNYSVSSATATGTITAKTLTVAGVAAGNKVYDGGTAATLTGGSVAAGVIAGDTVTLTAGTGTFADKNAGTAKTVTATGYALGGADNSNYVITQPTGLTANITAATLTVSGDNKAKTFGSADPALTFIATGFQTGDAVANALTGALTRAVGENAGTYAITVGTLASTGNYTLAFTPGTFTINPAQLGFSINYAVANTTNVYGTTPTVGAVTLTGVQGADIVTPVISVTNAQNAPVVLAATTGVGTYTASVTGLTGANAGNYILSGTGNTNGLITVTRAPLVLSLNSMNKVYGSADPVLGFGVTGLVNGETVAVAVTGTPVRAAGENVSNYAIAQGTLAATANYSIGTVNGGTLSITPATLNVTGTGQKTFGQGDPALTVTATGFQFADTSGTVLSGALTRATGENVGTYAIQQGTLTANPNYNLVFAPGAFTINPAGLGLSITYSVANTTNVYGVLPTVGTVTLTGVQGNDIVTPVITVRNNLNETVTLANTTGVGTYTAVVTSLAGAQAGNYVLTNTGSTAGLITITPAPLVITLASASKVYGNNDPVLGFTVGGLVNGESVATALTGAPTRTSGQNAGTYAISSGALAATSNYSVASVNAGTLTITRAPLSVSGSGQKTFGQTDPVLTVSASGFKFTDTAATVLTGALSRASGENAGNYTISLGTLAANGNYNINFTPGTFVINPATVGLSINYTIADTNNVYGVLPTVGGVTLTGVQGNDVVNPVIRITNAQNSVVTLAATTGVGVYTASVTSLSGANAGNYTLAADNNISGLITVTPAPLTITLASLTKVYGDTDPTFTFGVTGLVNGETAATALTGAASRTSGQNAGSYAISRGTLAATPNYTVANVTGGTLTISKATLTVTANNASKTFGDTDPSLTSSVSGFKFADTATTVLSGAVARAVGENAGVYAITQGTLAANANYNLAFQTATFTIVPQGVGISVTFSVANTTNVYGVLPTIGTVTLTGLQNGAAVAPVLAVRNAQNEAVTLATTTGVGVYTTSVTGLTGADAGNYVLTNTGSSTGLVTVTPAPLTITLNAANKVYGNADPTLAFTVGGLVNGEAATAALTGAPTRTAGENAGTYAVGQGTLAATSNYTITTVGGSSLLITPATLTVSASAVSKTYGQADPALTVTATGLKFADTATSVLTGALSRTVGSNAGTYAITQGTLAANANYVLAFTGNNLTINRAPLTVTLTSASKVYGNGDPTLGFTVGGLANGDTVAAALTGAPSRSAGENAGSYTIGAGTLAATSNYDLTTIGSGSLTITPATLTVSGSGTKIFGQADPVLTVSASGFKFADSAASVLTGALSRAAGENVGTYAIGLGSLAANPNYAVSFVPSSFVINPATVTLSYVVGNTTNVYGVVPTIGTTLLTGVRAGDVIAPVYTVTNGQNQAVVLAANTGVGRYTAAVTGLSGAAAGNYILASSGNVNGTITITPATLTLTPLTAQKIYGSADPTLIFAAAGLVGGDTAAILSGALGRTAGENAGLYDFTTGTANAGANYVIALSSTAGQFSIDRKAISFSVANSSSVFGTVALPGAVTFNGLLPNDVVAGTIVVRDAQNQAITLAAGTSVGGYGVSLTGLTGAAAGNYVLASTGNTPGVLTINKATLNLVVANTSKEFGAPNPAFGFTATGFVAGDTAATLVGSTPAEAGSNRLALTTDAATTAPAGIYAIVVTGQLANYNVNATPGTLTVAQQVMPEVPVAPGTSGGSISATGLNVTGSNASLKALVSNPGSGAAAVDPQSAGITTINGTPTGVSQTAAAASAGGGTETASATDGSTVGGVILDHQDTNKAFSVFIEVALSPVDQASALVLNRNGAVDLQVGSTGGADLVATSSFDPAPANGGGALARNGVPATQDGDQARRRVVAGGQQTSGRR